MGLKIHLALGQYRLCDDKIRTKEDIIITNGNIIGVQSEGKDICKKCRKIYYK